MFNWFTIPEKLDLFLNFLIYRVFIKSLGTEAFYSGNYPPSVPTWRFAAID